MVPFFFLISFPSISHSSTNLFSENKEKELFRMILVHSESILGENLKKENQYAFPFNSSCYKSLLIKDNFLCVCL